jgi:hypothetical protein
VSARGKKPTPEGMSEFLEALSTVGVPSALLSAADIRSKYAGIQAASRTPKPSTSAPSSEIKEVDEKKVKVHFLLPKVLAGKRSCSLPKCGAQQNGKGITNSFPGKPG